MPLDPDTIAQQLALLAAHRRTLAHLLQQAAQFGGEVLAPPQTAGGIAEVRREIRSIKTTLRKNGVPVDDDPNDKTSRRRSSARLPLAGDLIGGDKVAGDKIGSDKVMGDKRLVDTRGGDYAEGDIDKRQGTFVGGGIHIYSSLKLSRWWRAIIYSVGSFVLVGAMLIIYQFARPYFEPLSRMSGRFNVAVARFGQLDRKGNISTSTVVDDMARTVYTTLNNRIAPLETSLGIKTLPPEQTGLIRGATQAERAQAAERLADQINADVIFYGVLDADGTTFRPEFFLANRQLQKAEEAAGPYTLGDPIVGDGNIAAFSYVNQEMTKKIVARTDSLAQFVLGLGAFAVGKYADAAHYFDAAARADAWDKGGELIYLFQGNTAGKLSDFGRARAYYNQALSINSEYTRARLGLAAVRLQQAKGSCQPGGIDAVGLEEAMRLYRMAIEAHTQPALADIQTKANAGLGQAYLCLNEGGAGDYTAEAQQAFRSVIHDFDGGNKRVQYLAAEAYANLGFLSLPNKDAPDPDATMQFQTAAAHYRKAIELSRDRSLRAIYYRKLGFILGRLREYDQADEAYRNAIDLTSAKTAREEIETQRKRLQQERMGQPAQ